MIEIERALKSSGRDFVYVDGMADAAMVPVISRAMTRVELTKQERFSRNVRFLPAQVMRAIFQRHNVL